MTGWDMNTRAFEKQIAEETHMESKTIITIIVAVTICLAFLGANLAPFVNVIIPNTTVMTVNALFAALCAGAGVQVIQKDRSQS